jgi:hypothetical protein
MKFKMDIMLPILPYMPDNRYVCRTVVSCLGLIIFSIIFYM